MEMQEVIKELCTLELKQIRHCMKQGKLCDVNSCLTRMKLYKSIDLEGGATFWQEYFTDTGRLLDVSTEEEIVAYLQNHSPVPAQINGAVNELSRYLLSKNPSLTVQDARNKAFQLLGKDAEFIKQFLQEANARQAALLQIVSSAPTNVIDLTNEVVQSNIASSNIIDLTNDENTLSTKEQQLFLATTVGLISILASPSSAQAKLVALVLILFIYEIINRNYIKAKTILKNLNH